MSRANELRKRQREIEKEISGAKINMWMTQKQIEHYEKLADELEEIERKLERE